jgi:hypothetical protein
LRSANASSATVISVSNTSCSGIHPENKFDIDYFVEFSFSPGKTGSPPSIPVILWHFNPDYLQVRIIYSALVGYSV